jgi:hypothetical protein
LRSPLVLSAIQPSSQPTPVAQQASLSLCSFSFSFYSSPSERHSASYCSLPLLAAPCRCCCCLLDLRTAPHSSTFSTERHCSHHLEIFPLSPNHVVAPAVSFPTHNEATTRSPPHRSRCRRPALATQDPTELLALRRSLMPQSIQVDEATVRVDMSQLAVDRRMSFSPFRTTLLHYKKGTGKPVQHLARTSKTANSPSLRIASFPPLTVNRVVVAVHPSISPFPAPFSN